MTLAGTAQKDGASGFSLLEMIAALALLALAVGVVVPRLGPQRQSLTLRAVALQIASGMKQARSAALAHNSDTVFMLDVAARRFSVAGIAKPHAIPRDIAVSFETAEAALSSPSNGAFRFRPDGTATTGRIDLSSGQETAHVAVDWLTGAVSISWN